MEYTRASRSVLFLREHVHRSVQLVWWRHPSRGKPFAVQYRGNGHYYKTLEGALGYIEGRFNEVLDEARIMLELNNAEVFESDEAVERYRRKFLL